MTRQTRNWLIALLIICVTPVFAVAGWWRFWFSAGAADSNLASAADLVPEYLKAIPKNPVTGKNLN